MDSIDGVRGSAGNGSAKTNSSAATVANNSRSSSSINDDGDNDDDDEDDDDGDDDDDDDNKSGDHEGTNKAAKREKPKRPQNKAAADKYRRRKKERFEAMQHSVEKYSRENTELGVKATRLENEKAFLSNLLESAVRSSANPIAALLNVPHDLITPAMLPARVDPQLFRRSKSVLEQFVRDHDARVRLIPCTRASRGGGAGC